MCINKHLVPGSGDALQLPGSPAAVAAGCTCPVVDNAERPPSLKVVNAGCPLHAAAMADLKAKLLALAAELRGGLCFRCEERARFHEWGHAARYECGQVDREVGGCDMYRPVLPHALKPVDGERRPLAAPWAISGRACSAGLPGEDVLELRAAPGPHNGEVVLYYGPGPALRRRIRGPLCHEKTPKDVTRRRAR